MSWMTYALTESTEAEEAWHLPMPAFGYGAIALAIFLLLLLVAWFFRNAGHTRLNGPDVVHHHGETLGSGSHSAQAARPGHVGPTTPAALQTTTQQGGHRSGH